MPVITCAAAMPRGHALGSPCGFHYRLAPMANDEQHEMGRGDDAVAHTVRAAIRDVLGLNEARAKALTAESGLFGTLPELDSMAVMGLLTELEDRLGILIDDEDVDGDMLSTFGALTRFAADRVRA